MEARFVIKAQMTRQAMHSYQKAHRKNWQRILTFICTAFCIWIAVWQWIYNNPSKVFYSVLTLLILGIALFQDRLNAWIAFRGYNRDVGEVTYNFFEEYIETACVIERGEVQYKAFVKLLENSKYYFLYVQKRVAYILPKSAFVQGEPEEFRAFISEKTGQEIKFVRG